MRVCYPLVGDSIGGAQLSTITLIRGLPEDIRPVIVLHEEGALVAFVGKEEIDHVILPLPDMAGRHRGPVRQFGALARITPALCRFLWTSGIDIVHTQDGRMHASWALAARLCRIPHLWHQRTIYAPSRILALSMRASSRIIAISKVAARSLPPEARPKTVVIANPVSADGLEPNETDAQTRMRARALIIAQARQAGLAHAENSVIVALVGNLRAVKQPLLAARAVDEAARLTGQRFLLAVFGEDREGWLSRMREAMRMADAEPGGGLLLAMGFRHPVGRWLVGCDALLATSRGDAFGRTLVEAMAVGVPVVAVASGGHGEIVTDETDGLLVPDADPHALADALVRLSRESALRLRLIENGRRRARNFAPEYHVRRITAVYRELVPKA